MAEPGSAQTLQKLDTSSLRDLLHTRGMEESFITAEVSTPTSGRCLWSSPIWKRRVFEWAITFYTIKDHVGYFHTFPHVGGPFQNRDEANEAIDRCLTDQKDLTMGIGLSEVDKIIQKCHYFPDGTKKRLKAGEPIDKRRDTNYQLAQVVVDKYNDHHNLFADLAYELKDVFDEPSLWEEENYKMYIHMNFTAKTKGSDGFDAGSDNLFFAEITYVDGEHELTVNCCCMVNPFDNGPCLGCGTTMKHPNDGNAYTGGHMNASYSRPFGSDPQKASWCYDEDSDEEVERLRFLFGDIVVDLLLIHPPAILFHFSCNEEHLSKPTSAQTVQKLDAISVRDFLGDTAMEESFITAESSPSPPDTVIEASSPIWKQRDFEWAITFYTIKDLRGYFRTHPHVGGPFQSLDEAKRAIDRYLTYHTDLTMGVGLSEVDKLIQDARYFPDGTKRRLKEGQPIDKKRDPNYQLVGAVVDKYNDHHSLFGDHAYEVKDVLDEPSLWEEENYRMYMHMNFIAKTKGSNGFDTSNKLFFAEVTYVNGNELTVNCCCMVNPFDNGPCLSCGTNMKHPNDGNVYTGGRLNASYSLPFGSGPLIDSPCYDEDSDEEVERLRFLFGGGRATAGTS
ncbi:hypothetical protein ACQ4PT_058243 [Festuca glaucescens]